MVDADVAKLECEVVPRWVFAGMADSETDTATPTVEVPPSLIEQLKQSVDVDDPEQFRDYLFDRVEVSPMFVDPEDTVVREELTDGSD